MPHNGFNLNWGGPNGRIEEWVELVDPKTLQVGHYQRPIARTLINKIKKTFMAECFDYPLAGVRQDGSRWCVDGRSRSIVSIEMGIPLIPCRMFKSRGEKHEAMIFRMISQTRRGLKCADSYRAGLIEGDEATVDIDATASKYGLKVGYGGYWPMLSAIAQLYKAHQYGVLDKLLHIITSAWVGNSDALREKVVGGVCYFLRKFPTADVERCIEQWRLKGVMYFIQHASDTVGSVSAGYAFSLMSVYNKGLRGKGKQLEWRSANDIED